MKRLHGKTFKYQGETMKIQIDPVEETEKETECEDPVYAGIVNDPPFIYLDPDGVFI